MLNKRFKKGILITFEGIDGSGKSTQIKKLKNFLLKKKINNTYFTREPGGTNLGDATRKLLLKNDAINPLNQSLILLLTASRYEHYKKIILPNIKKKKIVISDRFTDSTFAYQCGSNKELGKLLKYLNNKLFANFNADLTILLDIRAEEAMKRLKKRKINNSFDKKTLIFYKSVRSSYLKLANKYKRIKVLDASINQDELFNKVQKLILKIVKEKCT